MINLWVCSVSLLISTFRRSTREPVTIITIIKGEAAENGKGRSLIALTSAAGVAMAVVAGAVAAAVGVVGAGPASHTGRKDAEVPESLIPYSVAPSTLTYGSQI